MFCASCMTMSNILFNVFPGKRGQHGQDQVWATKAVLAIIEQLQRSWWQKLPLTFSSPPLA